jgi:hypothetical protein
MMALEFGGDLFWCGTIAAVFLLILFLLQCGSTSLNLR